LAIGIGLDAVLSEGMNYSAKRCSKQYLHHHKNIMFKIEVQEENGLWHDVRGADGKPLTFSDKETARAKLMELYPVLVQMEKYAGGKRTRVISILEDDKD
jgi:hypothetical protein